MTSYPSKKIKNGKREAAPVWFKFLLFYIAAVAFITISVSIISPRYLTREFNERLFQDVSAFYEILLFYYAITSLSYAYFIIPVWLDKTPTRRQVSLIYLTSWLFVFLPRLFVLVGMEDYSKWLFVFPYTATLVVMAKRIIDKERLLEITEESSKFETTLEYFYSYMLFLAAASLSEYLLALSASPLSVLSPAYTAGVFMGGVIPYCLYAGSHKALQVFRTYRETLMSWTPVDDGKKLEQCTLLGKRIRRGIALKNLGNAFLFGSIAYLLAMPMVDRLGWPNFLSMLLFRYFPSFFSNLEFLIIFLMVIGMSVIATVVEQKCGSSWAKKELMKNPLLTISSSRFALFGPERQRVWHILLFVSSDLALRGIGFFLFSFYVHFLIAPYIPEQLRWLAFGAAYYLLCFLIRFNLSRVATMSPTLTWLVSLLTPLSLYFSSILLYSHVLAKDRRIFWMISNAFKNSLLSFSHKIDSTTRSSLQPSISSVKGGLNKLLFEVMTFLLFPVRPVNNANNLKSGFFFKGKGKNTTYITVFNSNSETHCFDIDQKSHQMLDEAQKISMKVLETHPEVKKIYYIFLSEEFSGDFAKLENVHQIPKMVFIKFADFLYLWGILMVNIASSEEFERYLGNTQITHEHIDKISADISFCVHFQSPDAKVIMQSLKAEQPKKA